MKYLFKSILAGIMIGIGGTVYLMLDNKICGSIFFAIGLFMIVVYNLNLYTGKIGFVIVNNRKYLREVAITLIGNLIGTIMIGYVLRLTRIASTIIPKAKLLVDIKINDNLLSIFILSVFCGILMYLTVNGYKKIDNSLGKYLAVFLGVIVFILSGFEHCVANMYYFSVANAWNLEVILYLMIMILGNSVGSFIFPIINKITKEDLY